MLLITLYFLVKLKNTQYFWCNAIIGSRIIYINLQNYPEEMDTENKFNEEMLALYHIVGKATGYWANYYLRSVRKNSGLTHAKKALAITYNVQKGFRKLIEVGRPDLSIEATVLKEEYKSLFSKNELAEAQRRIDTVPNYAWRKPVEVEENYSGEIKNKDIFKEGTTKQVTVNVYERNSKARKVGWEKHGFDCKVCGMSFERKYGKIGKNFIHIHHLKPLAGVSGEYELKPIKDLVPVCPNCHAMLHTYSPPLTIDELKAKMNK